MTLKIGQVGRAEDESCELITKPSNNDKESLVDTEGKMSSPSAVAAASPVTDITASLPVRKRKMEEDIAIGGKALIQEAGACSGPVVAAPLNLTAQITTPTDESKAKKGRQIRLEQNRKAARESRRRKKVMIEELQRSVIFFSRANGTLKQQNDELTRLLMQAHMQVAAIESHKGNAPAAAAAVAAEVPPATSRTEDIQHNTEQAEANAVATQAVYETKGYPAAAARAAAQTISGMDLGTRHGSSAKIATASTVPSTPLTGQSPLPAMQPGATMQAMANFQQAAAAAMQVAMGQMQNVPGVNMSQLSAAPAGTNAQQAYTDTMTALAMQQAAAAAAGIMQPGMQLLQPLLPQWQKPVPTSEAKIHKNDEAHVTDAAPTKTW